MEQRYALDMTSGPLLKKIIVFTIPILLSGVLQLLFNAADIIVVGNFAGDNAMAAVGSTSSLVSLLTNLFIGISAGANVAVANFFGAKDDEAVQETVHTSVILSLIGGAGLMVIGICLAKPILELMGSPESVLPLSAVYLRIFFLGMPGTLLFNFCSAILRATGDTKHPLYYLATAGILNVILNLFFVIVLKMSVAGVALATIISQYVSAFLIVRLMMKSNSSIQIVWRGMRISKSKLSRILRVGIPAGIQSGQQVRIANKGERGINGGPNGDLYIEIIVSRHKQFVRDGNDIRISIPISVVDAVLGCKIDVPTVYGDVELSIPAGTQHGQLFRLKGKGVKSSRGQGDQYVEVQLEVPTKLNRDEKELFEKIRDKRKHESPFEKFKKAFK